MKKVIVYLPLIMSLFVQVAYSDTDHSSPAGLRWQMVDDTGWSAHYERLGIKGTIQDQTLITFVEVLDGTYLDDSILEVFVTPEGQVRANRFNAKAKQPCLYIGQIKKVPTIFDQGFSQRDRSSSVNGSYTCELEHKRGEWSGTIFW